MNKYQINQKIQGENTIHSVSCANCWGYQQWNGHTIDRPFIWKKYFKMAFILNFAKKHF